MKYTLLKNRATGARSVRVSGSGELVREADQPERYAELRRRAIANARRADFRGMLADLGIHRVRGAMGGTYYE